MRYERPSTDDAKRLDSRYGESERATERVRDERELYGEPCHEADAERDEQTLYGEPQHEVDEEPGTTDPDLLFAEPRVRSGPTATEASESPATGTTER